MRFWVEVSLFVFIPVASYLSPLHSIKICMDVVSPCAIRGLAGQDSISIRNWNLERVGAIGRVRSSCM